MRGGAGRCSPGASSALTQIVHDLSSYYPVFHSVFYNSVAQRNNLLFAETFCAASCVNTVIIVTSTILREQLVAINTYTHQQTFDNVCTSED